MFGRREEQERLEARLAELEQRLTARIDAVADEAAALVERRLKDLQERLEEEPQERVGFLLASVAAEVRADLEGLVADGKRLRQVTEDVGRRHEEAERALRALVSRLEGGAMPPPRTKVEFNKVYQAETLGYVAAFFDGGRTDKVSVLIGAENPPALSYGELNTTNEINSYVGAIVRPGEYWMVRSKRGERSGVKCFYTPLY